MSTETKGSAPPDPKRAKDRSVWDVAKEAFENRLIEGDRPAERKVRTKMPSPE
jgi:hypothetical protein